MVRNRLPVIIMTGFLGSGKTTVLNRLLRDPRMTDSAVIVNEFGEIGLDHLLVESAYDEMVLMDNGCLCCSVRGDLVDTLTDLVRRVEAGEIPSFSRVLIETTGLADPAPIAKTIVSDRQVAPRFTLQSIVSTVDAVNGAETMANYDEARCQVAMADLVLLTKSDLASARVAAVRGAVRKLNPQVEIVVTENGNVDPEVIITTTSTNLDTLSTQHDHDAGNGHAHDHHHDGHDWNIQSASIVLDHPVRWSQFRAWLEWITAMRGPDVLRIKGLVAIEGIDGPVLVQGVQHVFTPPVTLADWPGDDRRSRIVVIARDIPQGAIRASLERFVSGELDAVA